MKTQIRRLAGQDPDSRAYFSRTELTQKIVFGARGADRDEEMPESPVLDAVLEIAGIIAAEVHPYHLSVRRSPMFEWAEIEPSILKLLTAFNIAGEGRLEEADARPPEAV